MTLLEKNSIHGLGGNPGPLFDLGPTSTIQSPDSLPQVPGGSQNSPYQDLDGNQGPDFQGGFLTKIQQQNALLNIPTTSQYQDLDGVDGGNGYFSGVNRPTKGNGLQINGKDLHVHLLDDTVTFTNGNSTTTVGNGIGGSEYMDLEGEPPAFDLGPDSNIQPDSLLNIYNYSHGGKLGQGGPVPKDTNSSYSQGFADLNSTFDSNGDIVVFNKGKEAGQDPSNPKYDTIHEQSLLAPHRDPSADLDLDGKTPLPFQGHINNVDKRTRDQLNQVPGGMTPSAYADINGTNNISTRVPNGAPIPKDMLFHRTDNPTKYKGLQIKGVDLHEHLLQNSYSYSHGLSSTIIKPSTSNGDSFNYQDLDIDIRDEKPTQYINNLPI